MAKMYGRGWIAIPRGPRGPGVWIPQLGVRLLDTHGFVGADEAAITTGNAVGHDTQVDEVTGTAVFDTARFYDDVSSARFSLASGTASYIAFVTQSEQQWARAYLYLTALPPAAVSVMQAAAGATVRASLQILATGEVRLVDAAGATLGQSAAPLPTGQWVRLEWQVLAGSGTDTQQCRVFTSPAATTPTETVTSTSAILDHFDRVRFGAVTAAAQTLSVWMDGVAVVNDDWVGPLSTHVSVDNYNDDSIDAVLWGNWGGGNVVESGQKLRLTTSTNAGAYFGIQTNGTYTITGRYLGQRVDAIGNTALLGYGGYPISLVFSTNNEAYWVISGGTASAFTNVNTVFTQRGSGITHVDGRTYVVGEESGNIVWKWSDNGTTWTTHATLANPFGGDQTVQAYAMVGTDQANGATTTMVVDDFGWYAATTASTSALVAPATITGSTTVSGSAQAGTAPAPGTIAGTTTISGTAATSTSATASPATISPPVATVTGAGQAGAVPVVATVVGSSALTGAASVSRTATVSTVSATTAVTGAGSASRTAATTTIAGTTAITGTATTSSGALATPATVAASTTVSGTPAVGATATPGTILGTAALSGIAQSSRTAAVTTVLGTASVTGSAQAGSRPTPATILGTASLSGAARGGAVPIAATLTGSTSITGGASTGWTTAPTTIAPPAVQISGTAQTASGTTAVPATISPPAVTISGTASASRTAAVTTISGTVSLSGTAQAGTVRPPNTVLAVAALSGTAQTADRAAPLTVVGTTVMSGAARAGATAVVVTVAPPGATVSGSATTSSSATATPGTVTASTAVTGSAVTVPTVGTIIGVTTITGTARTGATGLVVTVAGVAVIPSPSPTSPVTVAVATVTGFTTLTGSLITSAVVAAATITGRVSISGALVTDVIPYVDLDGGGAVTNVVDGSGAVSTADGDRLGSASVATVDVARPRVWATVS